MATIRLPPDFKEFLRLLNSHEVEYLLIAVRVNPMNLRHLKLNKQAAGRHKDLADVEHLPYAGRGQPPAD